MRRLYVFACALVAVIGVPALGFAQWIRYPTADLPRKADGKPDLDGAGAAAAGRQSGPVRASGTPRSPGSA